MPHQRGECLSQLQNKKNKVSSNNWKEMRNGTKNIINQSPDVIKLNPVESGSTEVNSRNNIQKVIFYKDYVRWLNGNVCSSTDCNPNIRLSESGWIIDAFQMRMINYIGDERTITHHSNDITFILELLYLLRFLLWENFGHIVIQTNLRLIIKLYTWSHLFSDGASSLPIISRKHPAFDAHFL